MMSAFDVQMYYLGIAQRELAQGTFNSEETDADLKQIALLWEQALNAIYRRDTEWMLGRFDHATKFYLAEREIKRRRITELPEQLSLRKDIDFLYHNITDTSLLTRMNHQWADRRIFTDAEIISAMIEPRRTRGKLRAQFIAHLAKHTFSQALIEWHRCGFSNIPDQCFIMDDPLCSEDSGLDRFLAEYTKNPNQPVDPEPVDFGYTG